MGIEYKIRFAVPSITVLDAAIRKLPFFRSYDEQWQQYQLWVDPSETRSGMPDAYAMINNDGVYFSDNCGPNVSQIKDALIALAREFDEDAVVKEL